MPDGRENGVSGADQGAGTPIARVQGDPYLIYVQEFSTILRQQVTSLKLCTGRSHTLSVAFRQRADDAFTNLITAIEKFRRDMELAGSSQADYRVPLCPLQGGSAESSCQLINFEMTIPEERNKLASPNLDGLRKLKENFSVNMDWASDASKEDSHNDGAMTPPPATPPLASTPVEGDSAGGFPPSRNERPQEITVEINEEDEDEVLGKCVDGVLNPNWPGRLAWDLTTMTLVLSDAMILPFQMAYKDGSSPDGFDTFWLYLTTSCFVWDIFINFFTAYTAGKSDTDYELGKLVTGRWRITKNYLKTWFPIDFFSTIPWGKVSTMFAGDSGSSSSAGQVGKLTKVVKFARFLRLMRMMKLAKLATIWERIEAKCGSVILLQGIGLLRVLFVLICICHWNACIWWMVGLPKSLLTEILGPKAQEEWLKGPHWTTITRSNGPGEPTWTWLERSSSDAYIFCFYWTLGVMRTMPAEVKPVNLPERLYIMVFMFFAFSAFAICVAQITQTFFKFSERKRVFNDDMAAVRMHLRKIKASDSLQTKVKTFLRHLYDTRRIQAKEQNMLGHLPSHVSAMLQHSRVLPHLDKLTIFQGLSSRALCYITEFCIIKEMAMGDVVCHYGCTAEAAYVLIVGRLQALQTKEAIMLGPAVVPVVVDEECLVDSENVQSTATVVCVLASSVLRVDKASFFQVFRKHPNILNMRKTMIGNRTSSIRDEGSTHTVPRIKDENPSEEVREEGANFANASRHGRVYTQDNATVEDTVATAAAISA
eukprot:TRINITY_DN61266_c0_g1_i1.p1 TRINITY_DN61266_c0_g1~~TRINITY_DN61266_c0_g1_i1.p1  ORF type:complete len:767 (+),score=142.15 TRINITY_DN61266_c0_g1_i1:65-2365(+)